MATFEIPDLPSRFRQLLGQCRDLYVEGGELAAREHAHLLDQPPERFVQLMDDLHRALVVKVFISICESDRRWSKNERFLAEVIIFHLWGKWLHDESLKEALLEMSDKAMSLSWYATVRPFDRIAPLRDKVGELETLVARMANLVARADGPIKPVEAARIKSIQCELSLHLRPIPIDEPSIHAEAEQESAQAFDRIFRTADQLAPTRPADQAPLRPSKAKEDRISRRRKDVGTVRSAEPGPPADANFQKKTSEELLSEALAELDRLIGLENIKREVRTLANFIKIQTKREQAGLPAAKLSLHMVFGGNPGTGKTTVARIVAKVFAAMGVLAKGHLVETDRSGLVAEYAGQTAPKTNKKVDESLDGMLFVDEAYTLIHRREDPYGHEAVQTLLKRMEDDRNRLVVTLAGYPVEMGALLKSNPGLSSRFSRHLEFMDYTPLELARIFGLMSDKNQYCLGAACRAKIIVGLTWLQQRRDRHFGNGRTVRNLFEHAIRRQANRIAEIADLSVEQLTTLEAQDVEFKKCPPEALEPLASDGPRFHITCAACQHGKDVPLAFLGQTVRCPKCAEDFIADWGEICTGEH